MKTNENDQLTTKYTFKSPFKFTSMYQAPFYDFKSENSESDLTELSWLTNNVQLFNQYNRNLESSSLDYFSERNSSCYEPNRIYVKNSITDHRALNLIKNCADEKLESNKKFGFPKKIPKKLAKFQTENKSDSFLKPRISTSPNEFALNYNKSDSTIKYEHTTNWGANKPQLTLSCLIFMAIVDSKEKCLPVRKIYEWIEMNFPFYKYGTNGWKSSIRHNLSFSKCFKKTDSNDDILMLPENNHSRLILDLEAKSPDEMISNSNKRRAPNTNGTCWTVCSESKAYLVQALKKSSFWFHNSKYFPNINEYISKYSTTSLNSDHFLKKTNYKKLKMSFNKTSEFQKEDNITFNGDDSENEEKTDLLRFMEEQQKELCLNNSNNNSSDVLDLNKFDSNDLAAAAVLASSSTKVLDLSSSSSSLSSAFSLLSSSSSSSSAHSPLSSCSQQQRLIETGVLKNHQNSDLEIEVASTLVGMKFSKTEF